MQRLYLLLLAVAGLAALAYLVMAPRTPGEDGSRRTPGGEAGAGGEEARPIRIGWTAWADAEFTSQLMERLLEDRMGHEVELVMADIGIQYQGVADGSLDVMLMAWLPVTHRHYWERLGDQVVNLGPIYTGARLGWVVPDSVPADRLASIGDLRDDSVQRRLRGRILGIDPGSGLMQASQRAIAAYGLDGMELVSASGAAMTAALDRAIRRDEWIVATGWNPHWMFAKWDLRYLEDPRGELGNRERIHALVRRGFGDTYPDRVTSMLTRFYLPLPELEKALLEANRTSTAEAVDAYIANHPERIDYWVTGELP